MIQRILLLPSIFFSLGSSASWVRGRDVSPAKPLPLLKTWDQARHRACTDGVRFQGRWVCGYLDADILSDA